MMDNKKQAAKTMLILSLSAAILFAQQAALQWLPNIELVSLLIIIYTLSFKGKVLYIIYIFVFLEGVYYGFDPWWWVPYLYIWTLLALVTHLFRSITKPLFWAVISGIFGLLFGALSSLPHIVMAGWPVALAYWVTGIPFDLVHSAANFIICLVLWKPLMNVFNMLNLQK